MRKIFTFIVLAVLIAACTAEDANSNSYSDQNTDLMSKTDFIAFMENIAIDQGALPSALNPDDSYYPFPIESIIATGEEKFLIQDPSNGTCLTKSLKSSNNESFGEFEVDKFADNNGQGHGAGNGNVKLNFKYTSEPGWYIYSISMNITEDCNSIPLKSNGEPDITDFNIRNCFGGRRTTATYTFRENCIPDCSCVSAYVVVYNLKSNGSVNQCKGLWVEGDQIVGSDDGMTNSFCKSECGEIQSN